MLLMKEIFRMRTQNEGGTIEESVMDLKPKSHSCGFGVFKDSLIKDQTVVGCDNKKSVNGY